MPIEPRQSLTVGGIELKIQNLVVPVQTRRHQCQKVFYPLSGYGGESNALVISRYLLLQRFAILRRQQVDLVPELD